MLGPEPPGVPAEAGTPGASHLSWAGAGGKPLPRVLEARARLAPCSGLAWPSHGAAPAASCISQRAAAPGRRFGPKPGLEGLVRGGNEGVRFLELGVAARVSGWQAPEEILGLKMNWG